MITVPYSEIVALAAQLAGRADDTASGGLRLPPSEATAFLAFLADELVAVWTAAAWPELTPAIASVTAANRQFSKREGTDDEMGDLLGIWITANPQLTTVCTALEDWAEADGIVRVQTDQTALFVEYLLPAPDLLDVAAANLDAYPLPRRFKPLLAFKAAGFLLATEDPALAEKYRQLGEYRLAREMEKVPVPWWRLAKMKK